MKMQRYDFDLIHTQGKHLLLADMRSVSDDKSKQISEETAKVKELQTVTEHLQNVQSTITLDQS